MSFTATIPYADATYGSAYFGERLRTKAWDDASPTDRLKALKQATLAIDNLNFAGEKTTRTFTNNVPDQPRQFPRGDDTTIPDAISQACCELALAFLDDVDPNLEMEGLQASRQSLGEVHLVKDTDFVQAHVRAGIPSIQAWVLLTPFLRDGQHPRIELHRGG